MPFRGGGDDRSVHGGDAGALGRLRSAGGVLLGPVWCVSGQQEGQGGIVVTADLQAGAGPSLATVIQVGRE